MLVRRAKREKAGEREKLGEEEEEEEGKRLGEGRGGEKEIEEEELGGRRKKVTDIGEKRE